MPKLKPLKLEKTGDKNVDNLALGVNQIVSDFNSETTNTSPYRNRHLLQYGYGVFPAPQMFPNVVANTTQYYGIGLNGLLRNLKILSITARLGIAGTYNTDANFWAFTVLKEVGPLNWSGNGTATAKKIYAGSTKATLTATYPLRLLTFTSDFTFRDPVAVGYDYRSMWKLQPYLNGGLVADAAYANAIDLQTWHPGEHLILQVDAVGGTAKNIDIGTIMIEVEEMA